MFAWRLKHEALAFRTNAARKGIPITDTKCLFCGKADEDGAHLFIKCKSMKEVWRDLAIEKERLELERITSVHAMLGFLWELDVKKRLYVLTFWWLWWSNRNKLREGKMPSPSADVARRTRSNVLEYMQFFGKATEPPPDSWRPPVESEYKINVDGSFVAGQHHVGWDVAVRTADGRLVRAHTGRMENINDAFAAKAASMSHAINMDADLGTGRAEFETDWQLLAEALELRKSDSSAYGTVIEDMKNQLKL